MISVIIPVYNVKPYLERCLDSVINQTYRDLEIIIIDDGSIDGSEVICDKYADKNDRIRVIHQDNRGLSAARNVGLDIAAGEWISFIDSDDWLEKDMYETLIDVSKKSGGDIISCKSIMHIMDSPQLSEDTLEITKISGRDAIKELLTQKIVRFEVWNKIWKRELIDEERFIIGQVSEDVHFDLSLFMKCRLFAHIDKSLYNYRVNRKGSTNSSFKIKRLCVFDEFDSFISENEKKGDRDMVLFAATMGCSFAINIFDEALRTNQSKEICNELITYFRKFYGNSESGRLKPQKTRLMWRAFNYFPVVTIKMKRCILNR